MLVNCINNISQGIPFWYGAGKAGFMGAVSGAISFGIGSIATEAFQATMSVCKALFEAGLHGITSGVMSEIQGGNFGSGFAAGAVSSLVSSGIQSLGQSGEIGTNADGLIRPCLGWSQRTRASKPASSSVPSATIG